jgi:ligand-binding sensor domain-containing protein
MNFKEEHGLPDQEVIDIAEDENGKIWLGTRLGLTALTFKTKNGEDSKENEKE